MKILYAILFIGICQMAYSFPDEETTVAESNGEQVADALVNELQETVGPNWVEHVPEITDQLEKLADKLVVENREDDSKLLDVLEEKPWLANQIMMRRRWKKIFHKIKNAGKKVLGSAAASLAGKAIAGAIAG
uniref:Venom protein family 16 protein 1 n=1 Tax=Pristhesancus plagipennis TaxID=1955184 RepID=A0A2K8JLZ4_PRIPG|nr:venom protein family 16 protein 1 [Pristhesancus plagipennis]